MPVKKCCVDKCSSSSIRHEDLGVTYHKFPKIAALHEKWLNVTQHRLCNKELVHYVCSRHFRKSDFQHLKDSKYALKPDAVPSIFPWTSILKMEGNEENSSNITVEDQGNIDKKDSHVVKTCCEPNESNTVSNLLKSSQNDNKDDYDISLKVSYGDNTTDDTSATTNAKNKDLSQTTLTCIENEGEKSVNKSRAISENENKDVSDANNCKDHHTLNKTEGNKNENSIAVDDSLNSSKESDSENLDAIKKFIAEQEKEIEDQQKQIKNWKQNKIQNADSLENCKNKSNFQLEDKVQDVFNNESDNHPDDEISETLAVASSLMDMILNQSETAITDKREPNIKPLPDEKGNNSVALTVGSEVEAKDFGEYWYPAKIVEVDYEEMEVLVHYENISKKHDEWISVSSPRLRPIGSSTDKLKEAVKSDIELIDCKNIKQESITEDKPKLMFVVGERCLARWRDNRRFIATIQKDLGDGQYEIMFDDGFHWTCPMSRLYKYKQSLGKHSDPINIGPSTSYPSSSNPSSVTCVAPTSNVTAVPNLPQIPPYHKHLFDPTRDYLGSKSERREMKRKLNIKEIFNIGQKRRKIDATPTPTKIVKSKRPNIIKKSRVLKPEIKKEIPDAVAAIIGTTPLKEDFFCKEIKTEDYSKVKIKTEVMDVQENNDEQNVSSTQDELIVDPMEEEAKLEKFEVQDQQKHVQVIDKIKEVIIKLEDVINKDIKLDLPKLINRDSIDSNLDLQKHVIEDIDKDSTKDKNEDTKLASVNDVNLDSVEDVTKYINVDSPKESTEIAKLECQKALDDTETDNLKFADTIKDVPIVPVVLERTVEQKVEDTKPESTTENIKDDEKPKKNILKVKKSKKLRLLQEKKVKKQVEKVKSELEEMKKQVEEMKKQMLLKTTELASCHHSGEMPESFLLPGEWCCKWVNGQPIGTVSEVVGEVKIDANNKPMLPRRSVQVEDKRLPPGWTKHMVRRSWGNSAGKWDVVLVSPENRRLHTRAEMRHYLECVKNDSLMPFEHALYDFGVHLKLARRMGWDTNTPDGAVEQPATKIPSGLFSSSPIVKQPSATVKRKFGLKKKVIKVKTKKRLVRPAFRLERQVVDTHSPGTTQAVESSTPLEAPTPGPALEDGYVYVGSLKVQVIENLLRCPAEGCFKNFRNNTLIKMHIKHYHRELVRMLGATPKVLDLAYARTIPNLPPEPTKHKSEAEPKTIKVKLPKVPKRDESRNESRDVKSELQMSLDSTMEPLNALDSPKLRNTLTNRPVKRPRVLLPVRRPDPEEVIPAINEEINFDAKDSLSNSMESLEPLDFETAISTHTVTKPIHDIKKKAVKRRSFASIQKGPVSEEDEWGVNSDLDTRSSFPRSGTPDSKILENKVDGLNQPVSSESNEDQKPHMYMYTENGERIKIVHMKREEIINCHCGVREEDGLMVQCELCLCWQHALCHNIQKESEVPEKYTCSICLNPRRGRRPARFLHDQDRMYEGLLPGAPPCETLRRSHELSGNLLRIQDALHALRVKSYVATKKNHPKLYLWAKDWENGELNMIQEKLNSDYSDLNIMISDIGKENLPLKPDDMPLGMGSPPSEVTEGDRCSQREGQIGPQSLLSGLLSSPGGASLDLPISTSDLERLAKSVQEPEECRNENMGPPQPEAAIENSACRERLLRHIQRCQALIDSRLDSIEAQVAELESQDPSFEDDETADFFPRTKQTIQMMMRDLDTMEELGIIT